MTKERPEHRSDEETESQDHSHWEETGFEAEKFRRCVLQHRDRQGLVIAVRQDSKGRDSEKEWEEGKAELWFQRPLHFSRRGAGLSLSPTDFPNLSRHLHPNAPVQLSSFLA